MFLKHAWVKRRRFTEGREYLSRRYLGLAPLTELDRAGAGLVPSLIEFLLLVSDHSPI